MIDLVYFIGHGPFKDTIHTNILYNSVQIIPLILNIWLIIVEYTIFSPLECVIYIQTNYWIKQ